MMDRRMQPLNVHEGQGLRSFAILIEVLLRHEHRTGSGKYTMGRLLLPFVTCIYYEHPSQSSSDEPMMRRARLDLLRSCGIQPWLDLKLLSLVPAPSAWDEWRFRLRKREYLRERSGMVFRSIHR